MVQCLENTKAGLFITILYSILTSQQDKQAQTAYVDFNP